MHLLFKLQMLVVQH